MRVSHGVEGYVLEDEPGGVRHRFFQGSAGDCKDKRRAFKVERYGFFVAWVVVRRFTRA